MNEKEINSFGIIYKFYEKWRSVIIEGDMWNAFVEDVRQLGLDLDIDHNPLGWHLMNAVLDTINDLYKGGMKPVPANYFGRDDI